MGTNNGRYGKGSGGGGGKKAPPTMPKSMGSMKGMGMMGGGKLPKMKTLAPSRKI